MLTYIQQKWQIPQEHFSQIDWKSHEQAINAFQASTPTFLVKFLHRWLPIGRHVHRYNSDLYQGHCPSCPTPVEEDFHHFLSCPNPERQKWQSTLRMSIIKVTHTHTDPELVQILVDGIHHWLRQTPDPPTSNSPAYTQLLQSQAAIGWSQLLMGRWSNHWQRMQLRYLHHHKIEYTHTNHGSNWCSLIIKTIWTECHKEWIVRNQALHGHDSATTTEARLSKAQKEIRALYNLKSKCFSQVRHTRFYSSPEIHFEKETQPHRLENWIHLNKALILNQALHRKNNTATGQHHIDDYFQPTST